MIIREETEVMQLLGKSKFASHLSGAIITKIDQETHEHKIWKSGLDLSSLDKNLNRFGLILNQDELKHFQNRLSAFYLKQKPTQLDFIRVSQLELFFIARLDFILNYADKTDDLYLMNKFNQKYKENAWKVILNDKEPLFPFLNEIEPLPYFLYSLYELDIPTLYPAMPMVNDNLIFTYTFLGDPLLSINRKTKNVQWFDKNKNIHFIGG